MMKIKDKDRLLLVLIYVGLAVVAFLELFRARIFVSQTYGDMVYSIVTRFTGGAVCCLILCRFSAKKIFFPSFDKTSFLLTLPCFLIAINNFRFIPFFRGEATIDAGADKIILFALMCIGVGFFEEIAFRGCIFMIFLRKGRKTKKGVFWAIIWSSAIFGAIHLTNLFAGVGNIVAILQQIGYSFLIGAMCAVVLLITGNIWYCVFLHGLYNFCGTILSELGHGKLWDVPTIIITVVLSVAVIVYLALVFIKKDLKVSEKIFNEKKTFITEENTHG